MKKKMLQPFHLTTLSPWPMLMSFNTMFMLVSLCYWFHYLNLYYIITSFFMMIMILYHWWRDVVRESMNQGYHTNIVCSGLQYGMILFIVSEILFFFSFFWSYFHLMLSPSFEIGVLWPAKGLIMFNPFTMPLLNTLILLSSGVTITLSHNYLIKNNLMMSIVSLIMTIFLGLLFSMFQGMEYFESLFTIRDSAYGSIFYMATGFHGLHVLIGTMFLLVNLFRMIKLNFSIKHFKGFEYAAWYWHFVDVVWLFLYFWVYIWPWINCVKY